jgi:hypothetical protein
MPDSISANPTVKDLKRWNKRRAAGGNWFQFYTNFLEVLSIEAACVVQKMINLMSMENPRN